MLKKFLPAALALVLSTGALTVVEAAQSQDNYCCRGGYCYTQSGDQNERGDWNGGGYCYDGQRGCR